MKNLILVCFVFICATLNAQDTQGFFLDVWQQKSVASPAYTDTSLLIGRTTTVVAVDFNDTVAKVSQYIYGNNANMWSGDMNNDNKLVGYIKDLNPHVLRWPGGNLSNNYFFNLLNRPADMPPHDSIVEFRSGKREMTTDSYYDLLKKTNSTGSICVNLSYARYGTGPNPIPNAAHYAAEWVRYDNGRSKFWELGNENFGSWQAGYEIDTETNQDGQPKIISGTLYAQICSVFIDSMRAAAAEKGHDIKIGAVAMDQNVTYDQVQQYWNEQMFPLLADKVDFIVVHSYYTPYNENSSVSTILNSPKETSNILNYINAGLAKAGKNAMPIALTEWNIFAIGSKQQVSYINGMHSAINVGELIKYKYGMANKWDLSNGYSNGDDHGMFAASNETDVPWRTPHPQFHYMYFFQKYFGDHMVNSSVTGNSDVLAYASKFSSGQAGVVLANKSRYEQKVTLALSNFEEGNHVYFHTLTGDSDSGDFSRKVYINGLGPTLPAGGPVNYSTIRPIGSVIKDSVRLSMPPLSVIYALIDSKNIPDIKQARLINDTTIIVNLTSAVQVPDTSKGLSILVNNSVNDSIISITRYAVDSTVLVLTLETSVLNTDTIYLSYINGNLQTWDSVALVNAENIKVENLLLGSAPLALEAYTDDAGSKVYVKFTKKMLTPPAGSFSLKANFLDEFNINIGDGSLLSGDSTIFSFTPAEPLYSDYKIKLLWNNDNIMAADGGKLNVNDSAPVINFGPLKQGEVLDAFTSLNGDSISVIFDKDIKQAFGLTNAFAVTVNGATIALKSVVFKSTTPNKVILCVKSRIYSGDQNILVSYSGTTLLSYDAVPVEPFEDKTIENMSTAIPSAVEEYTDISFAVYPNPTKNDISIKSEKLFDKIEIINIEGRKVYERTLNGKVNHITLPLGLTTGNYIIKIGSENSFESAKLIIE